MGKYSISLLDGNVVLAQVLLGLCIFYFSTVQASDLKTEIILDNVEPHSSFWLDNNTLLIMKYFPKCGVHIIKFKPKFIDKVIEHTCHWVPVSHPFGNTIIFRLQNDKCTPLNKEVTCVDTRDYYAYDYKNGIVNKVFVTTWDENFYYDQSKRVMYFFNPFKMFDNIFFKNSFSFENNKIRANYTYATDSQRLYGLHPQGGGISVLNGLREEEVVHIIENNQRVDIFKIFSASGKIYLLGRHPVSRLRLYLYSCEHGYRQLLDVPNDNIAECFYAKSADKFYVSRYDDETHEVSYLYSVGELGALLYIVKSKNINRFSSISPFGDKLLNFSIRKDKYETVIFDANILTIVEE